MSSCSQVKQIALQASLPYKHMNKNMKKQQQQQKKKNKICMPDNEVDNSITFPTNSTMQR